MEKYEKRKQAQGAEGSRHGDINKFYVTSPEISSLFHILSHVEIPKKQKSNKATGLGVAIYMPKMYTARRPEVYTYSPSPITRGNDTKGRVGVGKAEKRANCFSNQELACKESSLPRRSG